MIRRVLTLLFMLKNGQTQITNPTVGTSQDFKGKLGPFYQIMHEKVK